MRPWVKACLNWVHSRTETFFASNLSKIQERGCLWNRRRQNNLWDLMGKGLISENGGDRYCTFQDSSPVFGCNLVQLHRITVAQYQERNPTALEISFFGALCPQHRYLTAFLVWQASGGDKPTLQTSTTNVKGMRMQGLSQVK